MMMRHQKTGIIRSRWIRIPLYILAAIFLLLAILYFAAPTSKNIVWGLNYSPDTASFLGFDNKELFERFVRDLHPKYIRLTAYWENLEANKGSFDLPSTNTEYFLKRAEEENIKIILVLGHKQPRWPECHHPDWYKNLSQEEKDSAVLNMLQKTVSHFKTFSSVEVWQIENEPYFNYGPNCGVISSDLLKKEIRLIKSLDSRPVLVTDSGEKGAWLPVSWSGADIFGSTMYRTVFQDRKQEYLTYPIPPVFYTVRAGMNRILTPANKVYGVELQAEPWFNGTAHSTPWLEQQKLMNPDVFYANIRYAVSAGLERNYLWGVEWWYWANAQGHPEMLNAAKDFFTNNQK